MAASLAVVALLVAGCGGDADGDAGSEPEPSATTALNRERTTGAESQLTQEQAEAALPAASDLPSGWHDDPGRSTATDQLSGRATDPVECGGLLEAIPLSGTDAGVSAVAAFSHDRDGVYLGVMVVSYPPGDERGTDEIRAVRDLLTQCQTFLTDEEGTEYEYRASVFSHPQLGDATVAVRLSIPDENYPFTGERVWVTDDNHVVGVVSFSYGGVPDTELTEQVVRQTLERLSTVQPL